jgi:glyoxylase-like metal-dependent hydrolase (beta-lactamase superfamily II)
VIETILENLFRIEIPLPDIPLKSVNSYIVKGRKRSLVVDVGMNCEECRNALLNGLKELDVDLEEADFFITHLHVDHYELIWNLAAKNSRVYFNQPESEMIRANTFWEVLENFCRISGFPKSEFVKAFEKPPGGKFFPKNKSEFEILKEGDTIDIGDYVFKCLETPGHSPGHTCLYEPDRKILLSGDHILYDTTPNISQWTDKDNYLHQYLKNLDKVSELKIDLVLPGHGSIFRNCMQRIQEIKLHHENRNKEVLSLLRKGSMSAYAVASSMSWDIQYDMWEQFPAYQKWFATGEAYAHLKYLERLHLIKKDNNGQVLVFSLK